MKEIWKTIIGYEELYQISNYGDVKSLKRDRNNQYNNQEIILKKLKTHDGYLFVNLYKNGKREAKKIHRLVAEAFLLDKTNFKSMPHEDRSKIDINKLEINHKDENKQNNCVDNLEWCTNLYNSNYGNRNKKIKSSKKNQNGKQIEQYDLNNNFIKVWESSMEIERTEKIFHQNIINCCKRKSKTAGGYIWKYREREE